MGALLFFHFRVTNVNLINEKNTLIIGFQNNMDYVILLLFLYLAFKLIYDIYLSILDCNGLYASSATLLTILSHAGLDNYNGRQIEHLIGNRLRGSSLMSL